MLFNSDTEQPLQLAPCSQITDGPSFGRSGGRRPSAVGKSSPNAAAKAEEAIRKSRREMSITILRLSIQPLTTRVIRAVRRLNTKRPAAAAANIAIAPGSGTPLGRPESIAAYGSLLVGFHNPVD